MSIINLPQSLLRGGGELLSKRAAVATQLFMSGSSGEDVETTALALRPARSLIHPRFRKLKSLLLAGVFAGLAGSALAQGVPELPTDGVFTAGSGVIGPPIAGNLQVQQTSARGIIDWRTFSIGQGGAVSILNGQGATLNRVTSGQLSVIRGTLSATGSVYLVNPQGVVVSGEGRILAGGAIGLLTRDISNTDFLAGGPFTARGQTDAGVVNLGRIISRDGDVFLVGASVLNDGEISAGSGIAGLAAADTVVIAPGQGIRGLYVAAGSGGSGDVTVSGRIDAAAAALQSAGGDVYVLAGNRAGTIQATGVSQSGGEVWLSAPEGEVRVDGGVRATKGDAGGDITLSGRKVTVGGSAILDATGNTGGNVLVGVTAPATGLSDVTTIASGARILAGGPAGGGSGGDLRPPDDHRRRGHPRRRGRPLAGGPRRPDDRRPRRLDHCLGAERRHQCHPADDRHGRRRRGFTGDRTGRHHRRGADQLDRVWLPDPGRLPGRAGQRRDQRHGDRRADPAGGPIDLLRRGSYGLDPEPHRHNRRDRDDGRGYADRPQRHHLDGGSGHQPRRCRVQPHQRPAAG